MLYVIQVCWQLAISRIRTEFRVKCTNVQALRLCTACTETQCLYKFALYLFTLSMFRCRFVLSDAAKKQWHPITSCELNSYFICPFVIGIYLLHILYRTAHRQSYMSGSNMKTLNCTLQAGPPTSHYYCAVVLHSCIVLSPVGYSSNHQYHCCQLTRKSSCVSNF